MKRKYTIEFLQFYCYNEFFQFKIKYNNNEKIVMRGKGRLSEKHIIEILGPDYTIDKSTLSDGSTKTVCMEWITEDPNFKLSTIFTEYLDQCINEITN